MNRSQRVDKAHELRETDPEFAETALVNARLVLTGDSIQVDGIWWEIIEKMVSDGIARFTLLHFETDHVEYWECESNKLLKCRKRIWTT